MDVAHVLDVVKRALADAPPAAVGAGVAVFVLAALYLVKRRSTARPFALAGRGGAGGRPDEALEWAPPEQSYADRRGTTRREGAPVRVVLSSPSFRGGTSDGLVVDRSTGGLRVAMPTAVPPGSTLQVRAVNAPTTVGFVTVIVRSCKKGTGEFFEAGCEFEKTPPWNVLLLFG